MAAWLTASLRNTSAISGLCLVTKLLIVKQRIENYGRKERERKHYTTIEQSKKLLELRLNPESADCCWRVLPGVKDGMSDQYIALALDKIHFETDIPSWSLGALLGVMPRIIETPKEDLPFHFFQSKSEWVFQYGYPNETDYSVIIAGNTPLEAAYFMVVYLLENGFIKKES